MIHSKHEPCTAFLFSPYIVSSRAVLATEFQISFSYHSQLDVELGYIGRFPSSAGI